MSDDPYVYHAEDELSKVSTDNGESPVSTKPLHSLWSVFFATLFGSALGGVSVISISLFRLNRSRTAWIVLGCGVLFVVVLFVGLWQLPDDVNIPSSAVYVPQLFCLHLLAKQLYGKDLEKQARAGGRIASGWVGIGIGLLSVAVVLVVAVGAVVMVEGIPLMALLEDYGEELIVGRDAVYYDDGASKDDAVALAEFLKEWGYFGQEGADARIRYEGEECIISFCLYESSIIDEQIVESFQWIANDLAEEGFGPPTKVELCNLMFEPQKTLTGDVNDFDRLGEMDAFNLPAE